MHISRVPAVLYFDHNATTPVAPEVADVYTDALREVYGNASSTHSAGQLARQKLESARRIVAGALSASPTEIVFTSGGTEANNLALFGIVRAGGGQAKHVVTSTIEHPSVLEAARQLEREGVAVTYVGVDASGRVSASDISAALRPETVLVSIMHANNETGTLQPIAEIGQLLRERREVGQSVFFHSDGVQAFGKVDAAMDELGVDLYSISAHKIFAPKGVGALYVRRNTPLRGIQMGGRHERERRAGTENVPGVMAFARGVELGQGDAQHVRGLRDAFEAELRVRVDDVEVNGTVDERLPNTSNVLFRAVSAEALVIALDMKGMAVSTGAACSSGSVEPSHVLLAMGLSVAEARASARFSFGRYNTVQDVEQLVDAVTNSVAKLRAGAQRERLVHA